VVHTIQVLGRSLKTRTTEFLKKTRRTAKIVIDCLNLEQVISFIDAFRITVRISKAVLARPDKLIIIN